MKTGLLLTLAAAAMMVGCSKENVVDSDINKMDNAIGFGTYKNVSRGNPVDNNTEFLASGSFGVTAFSSVGASAYMGTASKGIKIVPNAGNTAWAYADPADMAFWPAPPTALDFYGYAPYGTAGMPAGMTALVMDKTNGMTFDYTVPAAEADQTDVMFALAKSQTKPVGNIVKMPFKHALTQVLFKIGTATKQLEVEVEANGIQIHNLKGSGTFTLTPMDAASWVIDATPLQTYTVPSAVVTAGYILKTSPLTTYTQVGSADQALMLLPQTFVAKAAQGDGGAFLSVKCKIYQLLADGTKVYLKGSETAYATIEIPISSKRDNTEVWERAKRVTYNILIGKGTLLDAIIFDTTVEQWTDADGGTVVYQ
ncbi:MAG: fimbrillin family protein [Alistipes sp.]